MVSDGWSVDSFRRQPVPTRLRARSRRGFTAARRATVRGLRVSGRWIAGRVDDGLSAAGLGFLSLATFVTFGTGPGLYATGVAFIALSFMARDE